MADSIFDAELIHSVSIYRRSTAGTADEWGAIPESVAASSTGVSCLIQQMEETIEFTRRGKKIQTRLCGFFKFAADILEDDIVEFQSKKYLVIAVEDAAGQGHHKEVYLWNMEN
jgi:hypothetical protein